jgi:lysophospholipid acyltransferase 7
VTVKTVLHHWNMTVQYWMATYIYKRVTPKKLGQPITMGVSAYWHGLHPGYYMSMLTTSPCILAENLMDKGFKRRFLKEQHYKYYDFCTWIFRTREFDYMSMGFILLGFDATIRFWRSIYFIGHFVCLFFICLGYAFCKFGPKRERKAKSQ